MSLDIKYNYPHTFFLSVAVITLIAGFYPFYINNFNFSLIHWTRILIHGILIIISITCFGKGFSLWEDKENKREKFEEIRKKRMEQECNINQQILEEYKLNNQIRKLNLELDSLKEISKKERKKKEEEINQLKKEILEKKQEIDDAKSILYGLKKDEISKLPDNFSSSASTPFLSGSTFFPGTASGALLTPLGYASSCSGSIVSPTQKKCNICGSQIDYGTVICPNCNNYCY
jgi:hypothetical protein